MYFQIDLYQLMIDFLTNLLTLIISIIFFPFYEAPEFHYDELIDSRISDC